MTSTSGDRSRRSGLRAPRFFVGTDVDADATGPKGDSTISVATFVLHCQRRRALGRLLADLSGESHQIDDDDNSEVEVVADEVAGSGAGSGTKDSTATEEPSMEQCISLLAPHLAVFRQQSCVDIENASGAAGSASSSTNSSDEIPPQLLRVARFFRWRWEPLKRALLRPPVTTTAAASASASGRNTDAVVEVGSTRHRLRLARALHGRGLLSLAEVDGLASAIERQEREDDRFGDDNEGNGNGDNEGVNNVSDMTARLRLALSRLPSDASGDGVGTDRAKRGLRYAKSVLAEWRERSIISSQRDGKSGSSETDCPSPEEVADWSLTAFTGIVLTNGIDGQCRNRQGVQFTTDDNNVESSFASILLDRHEAGGTEPGGRVPAGNQGNLGLAIDEKIRAFLSPEHIDNLTEIHLLSLSRLLSYAPCRVVEDYLVESITLCSQQRGGVGMKQVPKLIASYLSMVGTETTDGPKLEAAVRVGLNEMPQDERRKQALSFSDFVFQGAQYLLSCAQD